MFEGDELALTLCHGLIFPERPALLIELGSNRLSHPMEDVFRMLMDQEVLARFEVLEALGRGGAGDVHFARDRERGIEVAIKLISTSFTDQDVIAAEAHGAELPEASAPPRLRDCRGL